MQYIRLLVGLSVLLLLVVAAPCARAGEDKAEDPKAVALRQARLKWLNEQVRFIEALGGVGYDDLARRVTDNTLRGKGSPDGQPLNAEEKEALNRAQAKVKLDAALRIPDLAKKVEAADAAIEAMKKVVNALPTDSPLRLEAEKDLAKMYFKLGNELTEEYEKMDKAGAAERGKEIDATLAKLQKKMEPLAKERENLLKKNTKLIKDLGKAKDKEKKKKLMDERKELKKEIDALNEKFQPLQEEAKQLEAAKGSVVDAAVVAGKAREYYANGLSVGKPVYKKLDEKFWDVMGEHDAAENRREQREILKRLEAAFGQRINFSHKMENAYATRLLLYERGTPDHRQAVEEGNQFIDTVRLDYDMYLPSDKWVYIQWIRVLSHQNDDLDKPKMEDEEWMSDEEKEQARGDALHYLWPTARMRFVWYYHFTTKLDKFRPKDQRGAAFRASEDAKVRGMYFYAQSCLRAARGHYALADREPVAEKKKKLEAHADSLLAESEEWLGECLKARSKVGPVPQTVRLSARLKIKTKFHVLKAERLMKAGKKDAAVEEVQKALAEPGKVMMEGGRAWRHVVQDRIRLVSAHGKRIVGEEIEQKGGAVQKLAEADEAYSEAIKSKSLTRRRELYGKARDFYIEVAEIAKQYDDRNKRASWLPRTLFRIGICAWQAEDYLTGYFVNFALAREFASDHYPEDAYPTAREYATRSLGNLHACAGKLLDEDEKSEARRTLYADQLFLRMARDPNPDPRLVVKLIDTLKKLRMYKQALSLIEDVPPDHLYYRMAILLAADIHQTIMKQAQRVVEKIETRVAENERELTEDEQAIVAEKKPIIEEHSAKAEEFASIFVKMVDERPPNPTEEQKNVYQMEDDAIPGAFMIPINNQFQRGEYEKVLVATKNYVEKIKSLQRLNEEARHRYIALAHWLALLSHYRQVDPKADPLEQVAGALQAAEGVLPALEAAEAAARRAQEKAEAEAATAEADAAGEGEAGEEGEAAAASGTQQIKRQEYAPQAYIMLGSAWNNIANRYFKKHKPEEADLSDADQQVYDDYRKRAAGLFGRAEGIAYLRRGIGMHIGKIYYELEMYERAVDMYDKVIQYWSESLFTTDYLFQEEKGLADLQTAQVPEAMAGKLGGIVDLGEIKGAGSEDKLREVLNKYVRTINYGKNKETKEKIDAVLTAARETYRENKQLQTNLVQAVELDKREDLDTNAEIRQKLNRYVLEALYPSVLAISKPIPLFPTPEGYGEVLKGFGAKYPPTTDGQTKASVLKYMHDQDLVRLDRDKKLVADYRKDLEARRTQALKDKDHKTAGRLGSYLWLFENSLKRYLYGVKDEKTGQVRERSYYRARQQIAGIIQFNENELPLDEPEHMPTHHPKDSFLMAVDEALEFYGSLLSAKRRYALALVRLGENEKALRYLEELVDIWPGETELRIDLAMTHAAVGDNLAAEEFTQAAADHFIIAQIKAKTISDKGIRGSKLWWQAQEVMRQALTTEVLARKRCKADKVDFSTEVEIFWRGNMVKVKKKTPPDLEKQGQQLVNDLVRILRMDPPEETREAFETMIADLGEVGFKPPKPKPVEEPEPAPGEDEGEDAGDEDEAPDEAADAEADDEAAGEEAEGEKAEGAEDKAEDGEGEEETEEKPEPAAAD